MPPRPWNASYFLEQNENELHLKTNPWELRRIWVSTGFFAFSVIIGTIGYAEVLRLWHNHKMIGSLCIAAGISLFLYFAGVAFYGMFSRIDVLLNKDGLEYRFRLLVYRYSRCISLNDILRFEYYAKKYDSRHMGYYVKTVLRDDELLIFCASSDDAGWLTMELNYMRAFLLAQAQGENIPPFRQTCILNAVKYQFGDADEHKS